jgi:hypothetical protein
VTRQVATRFKLLPEQIGDEGISWVMATFEIPDIFNLFDDAVRKRGWQEGGCIEMGRAQSSLIRRVSWNLLAEIREPRGSTHVLACERGCIIQHHHGKKNLREEVDLGQLKLWWKRFRSTYTPYSIWSEIPQYTPNTPNPGNKNIIRRSWEYPAQQKQNILPPLIERSESPHF